MSFEAPTLISTAKPKSDATEEKLSLTSERLSIYEFTEYRLREVYLFTQKVLESLAERLGKSIEHLDIGCWSGLYEKYLVYLKHVSKVTAIDISERKVAKTKALDDLKEALGSGKLEVRVMDGTNMQDFLNSSFDSLTAIEIFEGFKGELERLFKEMGRVLKPGGVTIMNFSDQIGNNAFRAITGGFHPRALRYSREDIESLIIQSFCDDATIEWYGQMPIEIEEEIGRTSLPVTWDKDGHNGDMSLSNHPLTVKPVFDEEGEQIFNPLYWVAVVYKPSEVTVTGSLSPVHPPSVIV